MRLARLYSNWNHFLCDIFSRFRATKWKKRVIPNRSFMHIFYAIAAVNSVVFFSTSNPSEFKTQRESSEKRLNHRSFHNFKSDDQLACFAKTIKILRIDWFFTVNGNLQVERKITVNNVKKERLILRRYCSMVWGVLMNWVIS